jgi:hypothetical protein
MPFTAEDAHLLVAELGASLSPPQYAAFETAARSALAAIPCLGVGVAYRTLVGLQRQYFDPPLDPRVANTGGRHYRTGNSKLANLPPIGEDTVPMRAQAHRRQA